MTRILPFSRAQTSDAGVAALLSGASIEVMPRTAAKIRDVRALLPEGTRIYVAHIDGTPIDDMVATVERISREGFPVMPHVPARSVPSHDALDTWLRRYRDVGATGALVLAGGAPEIRGPFSSSMELLETGLFDKLGYTRLHIAGHPEGNRDIDPDGGETAAMAAARWKAGFAERTGAQMALVTQFAFEARPALDWADRLADAGVDLPIHLGVAGPAKLQTLIKYAMACGVGPSIRVLQRRAADLSKLLMPFTPEALLAEIAAARGPASRIEAIHFFPLGGITASAEFLTSARDMDGQHASHA